MSPAAENPTGSILDRRSAGRMSVALVSCVALLFGADWIIRAASTDAAPLFERDLLAWIMGWSFPGADLLLRESVNLSEGVVLATLVVVAGLLVWERSPGRAMRLALVYLSATAVHWGGKVVVGRTRPELTDWPDFLASGSSYPSGHALSGAAVFTFLAFVLTRSRQPVPPLLIWTLAAGVIAASGIGRLYVGVHWPSDVVVGWACGLILAAGAISAD